MQEHKNKKHLTSLNLTLHDTKKILKLKYCWSTYHWPTYHWLYNQTTQILSGSLIIHCLNHRTHVCKNIVIEETKKENYNFPFGGGMFKVYR